MSNTQHQCVVYALIAVPGATEPNSTPVVVQTSSDREFLQSVARNLRAITRHSIYAVPVPLSISVEAPEGSAVRIG